MGGALQKGAGSGDIGRRILANQSGGAAAADEKARIGQADGKKFVGEDHLIRAGKRRGRDGGQGEYDQKYDYP